MKRTLQALCCVLLLCAAGSSARAQLDHSSLLSATSVQLTSSNYYFAKPNELTIIVNIMGFVQRPGRYEISKSIDLVNLIALAGGAMPDGSTSDVKITRLIEADGRIVRGEFRVNVDDIAHVKPSDLILSPGDVIQIEKTGWSTFRDAFTVVVSAAIITTAVSQVIIATKR